MNATTTPSITPTLTAPLAHGPFQTFGDVRRAHSGHFFDPDTMRFFSSRIVDDYPIGGRFLRTTEQDRHGAWGGRRRCTLRVVTTNGDIESVGEFGEFDTAAGAKKVVDKFDTVSLSRVVDDHGRTFWHVHLMGAQTSVVMRAGSAYYDLTGALALYDDLTGNDTRRPLHDAIAGLDDARHVLYRLDDSARAKVARQMDVLARRRAALVDQLMRAAKIDEGR